jgi:mRNA-degrading endonuclease RelE of RelBE toxin-antitoxin system
MSRLLFTEHFVKKFESILESNPTEAQKLLNAIDKFDKNEGDNNVTKIDEDGYSLSLENYRLLFEYKDNQIIFLAIIDLRNIFDLDSNEKNTKKKYSFA